ncbi:hypothetical protein F2Q70_00010384 [Brassica cretica]|uniref:thioglucosidase n=1 Tax=Brassica cretica TaxID=69181 RepID=A0A8S9M256_BRACR|nr:hypothetical protein F2Q70_00010384 [Brassica cretica]
MFITIAGDGPTEDIACDGYHKYKEDVRLMYNMRLDAFRLSISWPRLIPSGRGPVNPKGLRFYKNFIDELIRYGKNKIMILICNDFTAFADVCFREFGSKVKSWWTINEPNMLAWGGYDLGVSPPVHCSPPFGIGNCSKGNSSTEPYIALR